MKHFSDEQWADFAANLVSSEAKMMMQQHIDSGCASCAAALQLWQGVRTIAAQEETLTPSADTIRVVKAQFGAVKPQTSRGVRLVFDSNLQPVTAGLRGAAAARQFLYETDDYYVDLRLEPRTGHKPVCLVGQVLRRGVKSQAAQELSIRLQKEDLHVAETTTNPFGEFQLEFEAKEGLSISISTHKESDVILPLYGIKPVTESDKG